MSAILSILKRLGERRPYFHLYGGDGSLYMGRWWLLGGSHPVRDDRGSVRVGLDPFHRWAAQIDRKEIGWIRGELDAWIGQFIAIRLHHIAREDRARHHHTHPASFISIVIAGWYRERRPYRQVQPALLDEHEYTDTLRKPGSIAFRRASDRHTITEVSPGGCWTVVIWFRKQSRWGFHTPDAFIDSRDYPEQP